MKQSDLARIASLAQIKQALAAALAAAKRDVDSKLMVLALDARNAYVTVPLRMVARDARGAQIMRKDPKTGKMLPVARA